jgi:hypothetical protein
MKEKSRRDAGPDRDQSAPQPVRVNPEREYGQTGQCGDFESGQSHRRSFPAECAGTIEIGACAADISSGLLKRLFRLHRQADGDFARAIEHFEYLVAQETAELAFDAMTARQFDPPVTGAAIRTDDVGFLHDADMCSVRFEFDSAALSQSNDRSDTTLRRE